MSDQTMNEAQIQRVQASPRWIAIDEYVRLLTSRQNLVRQSDGREGWSGLLDTDAGVCYAVEDRDLLRYRNVSPRGST